MMYMYTYTIYIYVCIHIYILHNIEVRISCASEIDTIPRLHGATLLIRHPHNGMPVGLRGNPPHDP